MNLTVEKLCRLLINQEDRSLKLRLRNRRAGARQK